MVCKNVCEYKRNQGKIGNFFLEEEKQLKTEANTQPKKELLLQKPTTMSPPTEKKSLTEARIRCGRWRLTTININSLELKPQQHRTSQTTG